MLFALPAAAQPEQADLAAIEKRATAGNLSAQKELAKHYQAGGQSVSDMRRAAGWLQAAATQGDADAQTQWARFLTTGLGGVKKDPKAAVTWLVRATAQDHQPAQMSLAWHYRYGKGVQQNHQQAAHWYQRGIANAKWELPSDYFYLGMLYRSGTGVAKDSAAALAWFQRAAKQQHPPALYQLGLMHQDGEGVPANPAKAAEYFRAVEQGSYGIMGKDSRILVEGSSIESAAKTSLAFLYWKGLGVAKDISRTVALFTKAATQGNVKAQYNLGLCYLYGEGVERNVDQALVWLTKSASDGYTNAQLELGRFYENGIAVPRNAAEAKRWYALAAEQGSVQATSALAKLEQQHKPKTSNPVAQRRSPAVNANTPNKEYSVANDVTAGEVVGGLAVIAGLIWLADAATDGSSNSNRTKTDSRPLQGYVAQCRQDVYRRIYRCYTHGSVCDINRCEYEWNCQTKAGGRGLCRRYSGYSDNIENVFCDPKVGKGFRTEEEVMAYSCR